MATSILSGKPHRPQQQSQSQSGLGGIAGNLVSGLLSGGKPQGQQHHQPSMFGSAKPPGSTQPSGLMGLASGLLGHHGSSVCEPVAKPVTKIVISGSSRKLT